MKYYTGGRTMGNTFGLCDSNWNRFWNRFRNHIGRRKLDPAGNKGFSLVELIIVIAIMSILAAAIAPALIRYINKSRKADDIAVADSLGTTLNAAINDDDDVYAYINKCASWIKSERRDGYYRVICYMNAGYDSSGWTDRFFPSVGTDSGVDYTKGRDKIKNTLIELMGAKMFKLKFTREIYFDQWLLCCDKDEHLYVFVGGGFGTNQFYLTPTHFNMTGHGNRFYMLWPEQDPEYHDLETPPDNWVTN